MPHTTLYPLTRPYGKDNDRPRHAFVDALLTLSHVKAVVSSRIRFTSSVIASVVNSAKAEQSSTVSSKAADAKIDEDPPVIRATVAAKAWRRDAVSTMMKLMILVAGVVSVAPKGLVEIRCVGGEDVCALGVWWGAGGAGVRVETRYFVKVFNNISA